MQKNYIAIFSLFEIDTPFNFATCGLVVFVSQILSLELQKNELLLLNCESNFSYPLADLLGGIKLAYSDVAKLSNLFNHSISDNYTVVVIKSLPFLDSCSELPVLRNRINNLLRCNFCIIYERSIVMVIDRSFFNSFDYLLHKFEDFLSATKTNAGVSSSFSDFFEVRKGYVEASKEWN